MMIVRKFATPSSVDDNVVILLDDDNKTGSSSSSSNSHHQTIKLSSCQEPIPASWLWVNDPCSIHSTSGQRFRTLAEFGSTNKILEAKIVIENQDATDDDDDDTRDDHGAPTIVFPPVPPMGSFHPIGGIYNNNSDKRKGGISTTSHSSNGTKRRQWLQVKWSKNNNNNDVVNEESSTTTTTTTSHYDVKWLQQFWNTTWPSHDEKKYATSLLEITPNDALGRIDSARINKSIQRINYHDAVMEDDNNNNNDGLFRLLNALVHDGAVLIESTPDYIVNDNDNDLQQQQQQQELPPVVKLGKLLGCGALSHTTLYGETFHVVSVPNAHNLAYTSHALPPHQDLSYYESMPGLQLLHCIQNTTTGGESTLIDAMAAAHTFRQVEPELFDILTTTLATFVKQREGAELWYQRPHIVTDKIDGMITTVNWSPPFEGPLVLPPPSTNSSNTTTNNNNNNSKLLHQDYTLAYTAFACMLDNHACIDTTWLEQQLSSVQTLKDYANNYTWEYKLQPGEMLIFSNRRMLHGRRAFELEGDDRRHLMGAYTNLDDTIGLYRTLLRERRLLLQQQQQGEEEDTAAFVVPNVGNGSRGTVL